MNIWSKAKENPIIVSIITGIILLILRSVFKSYLDKLANPNIVLYIFVFLAIIVVALIILLLIKWLISLLRRKILEIIDLESKLNRELVLSHYLHFHERAADESGLKDKMETLESPSSFPDLEKAIDKIIGNSVCGEEYAKEFVKDTFIFIVGRLPNDNELKESAHIYTENCNSRAWAREKTYKAKLAVINFIREQVIPNGTLIRGSGDSVYLVQGSEMRLFPDRETFLALGYKFKDVRKISGEEINKTTRGKNIKSVKTARKVRHQNTGEVYLILDGKKHWLPNPKLSSTFLDNNNPIEDIPAEEIRKYPKGRELSDLTYNTEGEVMSANDS